MSDVRCVTFNIDVFVLMKKTESMMLFGMYVNFFT
jgi:hypothetical protein